MPVIHASQAVVHELHDTRFTSYASPERGSRELCAWQVEVPARSKGAPHHVTREEVLCVLSGTVQAVVDGHAEQAAPGDVILVPAGSQFGLDNQGDEPAVAWVTTSVGLQAVLPDGSWLAPPWTR